MPWMSKRYDQRLTEPMLTPSYSAIYPCRTPWGGRTKRAVSASRPEVVAARTLRWGACFSADRTSRDSAGRAQGVVLRRKNIHQLCYVPLADRLDGNSDPCCASRLPVYFWLFPKKSQ